MIFSPGFQSRAAANPLSKKPMDFLKYVPAWTFTKFCLLRSCMVHKSLQMLWHSPILVDSKGSECKWSILMVRPLFQSWCFFICHLRRYFVGALLPCRLPSTWEAFSVAWDDTPSSSFQAAGKPPLLLGCGTGEPQECQQWPGCCGWSRESCRESRHRELIQPWLQLWQALPWRHCWGLRDVLLCEWLRGVKKEARENYWLNRVSIKFNFSP